MNHLDPSIKKGEFSEEEDGLLREAVERRGQKWSDIVAANELPGRTYDQIRNRYMNHLDPSIKKGEFSEEEDGLLMEAVERRGQKWSDIAAANELPGRTYLQIRNRYMNHLDPSIKKGEFSEEEDGLLMEAVERRGHKWSDIVAANELPGRTCDQIKNRYMKHLAEDAQEKVRLCVGVGVVWVCCGCGCGCERALAPY
jgi:hypothetical protein